MAPILFYFLNLLLFSVHGCFAWKYICVPCVCWWSQRLKEGSGVPWVYSHTGLWTAWCGAGNLIQSSANTADSDILQAISPAIWLPSQRCKLESECVKNFSSSLPPQRGNGGLSHLEWLEQRWRAQHAWSQRKAGMCCSFCDSGYMFFHSRHRCWVQLAFRPGKPLDTSTKPWQWHSIMM